MRGGEETKMKQNSYLVKLPKERTRRRDPVQWRGGGL